MAKNEEKVMQFVKAELEKNPDASTNELFEKAKSVDAGVKQLSLRQFNARFPLQIKRKASLAKGGGRRRSGGTRRSKRQRRDNMRELLMRFASDLSAADERKDLVQILARVDDYVDDAMKIAGR